MTSGTTVVVKLGGRVQSDPRLGDVVRDAWQSGPRSLCLVHGGGDEISALQRQLGREPSFHNGRRVTSDADMDLVRMILSGVANKRLVASLSAAGVPAVGVSGEDGSMLSAKAIDPERFGRAGKPVATDVRVLTVLLDAGFLPVISPVARDASSTSGAALNVNGDDAAADIAGALGAELWMIADVPGVLDDNNAVIPRVDPDQMESLVAAGTVSRGMHAKLEAGFRALEAGSPAVRIASLDGILERDSGTLLSLSASMR